MHTRFSLLLLLGTLLSFDLSAQVAKQIIVEHFTNTRCGICASRNPGFYANLANQDNVLHIAYHPSSPYSSCLLNQHNTAQNDGRTQYYGIYGSTPKLVIQGNNISPSANYNSDMLFDDYEDETTPIALNFSEATIDGDSIRVNLTATTMAAHNLTAVELFVALVEDTIYYNAPNGEDEHYDVFRRSFTPAEGMIFTLASEVDGVATFSGSLPIDSAWNLERIYPIAILQKVLDRSVIQSSAGPVVSAVVTSVNDPASFSWQMYPNPAGDFLYLENINQDVRLYNMQGMELARFKSEQNLRIDLRSYPVGTYLLRVGQRDNQQVRRFIKQ